MHYEKFQDGTVKCIEDEIPFEVPDGWEWCRLSSICTKIIDGAHNPPKGVDSATEYIMASSRNISNDEICDLENVRYLSKENHNKENQRTMVSIGDVLLTTVATLGRSCIYRGIPENLTFQRSVTVITPLIDSDFLKVYFDSHYFQGKIASEATGTAQKGFYLNQLVTVLVPVPSLSYQVIVATKVEEHICFLNKIDIEKSDLSELLNATKSKILDLAISGHLVQQDPNDEPASVLLERIRSEKEELIKQGNLKRDKKESIIYKGDDNFYYQTGSDEPLDTPFDIPDTWVWSNLKELCNYGECNNTAPDIIPEEAWILDLEDIEKDTGKIISRYTNKERKTSSTKHAFKKDMVLYSKLRPYLNKVVLADDDGFCTSEIIPLKFCDAIYPRYAQLFLMSPHFVSYANHCSYGMKMPRLGTKDGQCALFAIPPYSEQRRIANMAEQLINHLMTIGHAIN